MLSPIIIILAPAACAFAIGMLGAPILAHYLYKYRAWKKTPGKQTLDGNIAHEFNRLHLHNEVRAPRMGGIVVWGSALITIMGVWFAATIFPNSITTQLNYLSRGQTWVPLATLLVGALVGLIDDLLTIQKSSEGLRLRYRLLTVVVLSACIGWWFWAKLDVASLSVPFSAPLEIGWLIIPFFIVVSLGLYASGVIDGIDGLSGGVFASIFASYTVIAYAQNQIDLAAFTASIAGGLLAFLWYNVPPARFYMSDTGTMALTLVIGVVALMTDNLGEGIGMSVLPIIGILLVVTTLSDVVQVLSKLFFGKKILRIAPLHHHFEAIGWPSTKVTMRYWILSIIFSFLGVIVALSALS